MKNKNVFIGLSVAAGITLLLAVGLSLFFPGYIQNLLQHPDGSYLAKILLKHQLKNPTLHTPEYYATFIPEVIVRILGLGFLCLAGVALLATVWREHLIKFWNHPSTAFNLGILRISLMVDFFRFDLNPLNSLINLTPEGMNIPTGYAFLKPMMPPPAWLVYGGWNAYLALTVAVMVGLFTRLTAPLLALVSFFVLLGPQLVGKMNHHHHLFLGILFLSMSPCGDALSIDWLIKKMRGQNQDVHTPSVRYGRPMVYLWIMMGAIYFFPGFWKFAAGGFAWAFSDNVQLKILAKVFETGAEPVIPLYKYPLLCQIGGALTILLEVLFPFAMVFPWGRTLFAVGGIAFHESNRRITQIGFDSIHYFYVSFVNWSWFFKRVDQAKAAVAKVEFPRWQTATAVGILSLCYLAGMTAVETWPWACYPTFAPLEQNFVNSVSIRLNEGSKVEDFLLQNDNNLIEAYNNRTRLRSYLTIVMAEPNESERRKMLEGLFAIWKKNREVPQAEKVEFWQVQVPLLPIGAAPVPYKVLGSL